MNDYLKGTLKRPQAVVCLEQRTEFRRGRTPFEGILDFRNKNGVKTMDSTREERLFLRAGAPLSLVVRLRAERVGPVGKSHRMAGLYPDFALACEAADEAFPREEQAL